MQIGSFFSSWVPSFLTLLLLFLTPVSNISGAAPTKLSSFDQMTLEEESQVRLILWYRYTLFHPLQFSFSYPIPNQSARFNMRGLWGVLCALFMPFRHPPCSVVASETQNTHFSSFLHIWPKTGHTPTFTIVQQCRCCADVFTQCLYHWFEGGLSPDKWIYKMQS